METFERITVNSHKHIARFKTHFVRWGTLARLCHIHLPVALTDIRADTTIFAGGDSEKLILIPLADIFRVGVYLVEHGTYGGIHGFIGIYTVHIIGLQRLVYGSKDVKITGYVTL